jgi:glutamine synthetase
LNETALDWLGTDNHTTPLGKCDEDHWEFRLLDGLANPYLALAAILSVGADDVAEGTELSWRDCNRDPAHLSAIERQSFGITGQVPIGLTEALDALEGDARFVALMSPGVVQRYLGVKRWEISNLPMDAELRREYIIDRF